MPTCPSCNGEFRTRKQGTCPGCGEWVDIWEGQWYVAGEASPPLQVVEHFENWVSRKYRTQNSSQRRFQLPRQGARWAKEMKAAARYLEAAEFDVPLVKEAIDLLFDHPEFNFKTRTSLLGFNEVDFGVTLFLAQGIREEKAAQARINSANLAKVEQMEDLFDYD